MKRKPLLVMFVLGFVVGLILVGSPANAKGKPTPATNASSLVANVSIFVSKAYDSNDYVVYASHYVGMEDTPYGTYPRYEPCTPDVCGTVVVTTGRKPTIKLSKLASETVVPGSKSYASADYSQSHNFTWDGSAIPLTMKFRDKGQHAVVNTLQYAWISLNKAGDPVPPVTDPPCCK